MLPMKAVGTEEAADMLGWSTSTLIRAADRGDFPCWRTPGGHRRFSVDVIEAKLAERCPDKVEEAS